MFEILIFYPRLVGMVTKTFHATAPLMVDTKPWRDAIFDFLSKKRMERERMTLAFLLHCEKKLSFFLTPARMSLTKLSLDGNYYIIRGQGTFG
jgi:hypothetical protein